MLSLLSLEFRKMLGSRSARLALLVTFFLPLVWAFAPRLNVLVPIGIISGWQLPAVSLGIAVQTLIPLFLAVTVAELIGAEVSQGTLAPLLLRPVDRTRVILSKLVAALTYPFILVASTVLGALLAGIPLGFGSFTGGTGLGPGLFVGVGELSSAAALGQVVRGSLLAGVMLMPIAALALLFGVLYINTAAAALATIAALSVMRLLVVFPEGLQRILLTSHLNLYVQQGNLTQPLILLLIYTLGFGLITALLFENRDL
ncbi:ABC transporter permease [Deinococcus malanensis]|uniref:ABC transporter permease n=1 Tax=Deinococcus malanensis TaxID=1706855 RepID=A0ABQ2ERJ5_9DEIO|nr:ABC transporter permease [Deinococcus malanensis]GGK22267.1 ABC transporter permease [Deinococcus malanensis]